MKRHLSLVVSVLVLVAMVLSISACSVPDAGAKHEHAYSADWSYDATNHWHAANCADNDECKSATADVAAHTLEGNTCSVCGYVKPADPQPEDPKPEDPKPDPKPETPVADGTVANPFALTVPGSLEIDFAGGYAPIWYAFTATETKTLSITLSSNNAVVGYGVAADSITYSNGETVVEFSVEAGAKYFVNFSTLDGAAAEYTVATEYVVKASPYETVLYAGNNTLVFSAEEIEADAATRKLVINTASTYKFACDIFVSGVVTADGTAIEKVSNTFALAEGEYYVTFGMFSIASIAADADVAVKVEDVNAVEDDEDDEDEDYGESDFVVGENYVTLTDEEAVNGKEYTFVVYLAGVYTFDGDLLAVINNSEDMYVGRYQAYLEEGVYTIVLINVEEVGGDFVLTISYGDDEESSEPDGSYDYPFVVEELPYSTDVTIGTEESVYYTFTAPGNGYITIKVTGENLESVSVFDSSDKQVSFVVLAGESYTFNLYNDDAEVACTMEILFEEATLTADDYKQYMLGKYAYDEDWAWFIGFYQTETGVCYATVTDGDWTSVYYYDYAVVVNADGSVFVTLVSILDLSELGMENTGDEYVLANEFNVVLVPGEYGYVLVFEAEPIDESELSGTGAKNDPYVIPGSGVYAFADVNDYPGKAISFTADKALTLKLSADVAELYTLSFSSKLAGADEVYEITLAEGETFSCFVCMFSGTADVKLTVEVADVESGDNEEDDEEIVDGTEYYGTDNFGSSLTLIVGDSTVTFIYSNQMMGESTATFVYLLVDGAFVLYANGEEVNPLAANITVDENGVPTSAVYNGYSFALSTEKPGEGEEEEQTNNLVVGENELVVVDTQMGDTYNLPVNADATVTYTITAGANTVFIVNNTDVYFQGNSVDVTVPAGETVSIVVGPYYNEDPAVIVVVAVKDAEAEEQKTVLHVGSNSVTVESSGGSIVYLPVSENNVVYTVTVGRDTIIDYNDGWYDTQGATFEVTVPAGEYVGIRAMAGDSANPRVTIGVAIKETSTPEEEPDPHAGLAGNGTSSNPYVLVELPFTVTFPSAHDVYYVYTATEACVITIVCPAGCLVSETGATKNDEGNYVITLEAGATLCINPWDMGGTAPYTYTISAVPVEVEEEKTVLHIGSNSVTVETSGGSIVYLPVSENDVVYTVTVGRDTIIDYNDGWYDTQGATFEVTVPAGEYVGIRAMAGDSMNPRVTIGVAIKETVAPEEGEEGVVESITYLSAVQSNGRSMQVIVYSNGTMTVTRSDSSGNFGTGSNYTWAIVDGVFTYTLVDTSSGITGMTFDANGAPLTVTYGMVYSDFVPQV